MKNIFPRNNTFRCKYTRNGIAKDRRGPFTIMRRHSSTSWRSTTFLNLRPRFPTSIGFIWGEQSLAVQRPKPIAVLGIFFFLEFSLSLFLFLFNVDFMGMEFFLSRVLFYFYYELLLRFERRKKLGRILGYIFFFVSKV